MSRSALRVAFSSICLVLVAVACGGRSDVPGTGFDEPSPFLSGAAGGTGKAGGGGKAGLGGGPAGFGGAGPGTGGVGPGTGGVGPGAGGGPGTGGFGGAVEGGGPQSCTTCFSTTGAAQCPSDAKACLTSPTCAKFDSCVKQLGCLELAFGGFTKCISQCGGAAQQQQWLGLASCQLCGSSCSFSACAGASSEVCGAEGPGGGPQGCTQGAPCQAGSGCAGIDPFDPSCTNSCNCVNGAFQCATTCSGPGAGGGPGDCNSCVSSSAKAVCPGLASQCAQFPGCTGLFDCITKTGCHSAPNPIACASQSGCFLPAGPATNVAADLSNCSKCNGCGICPISPGECGSNPGPGGGPGAGGGSGQQCGDCTLGVIQTGQCPKELSQCEGTPGCLQVAQCAKSAGCLELADPVGCAQKSCKGTPQAFASFGNLFQCAGCGVCPFACLACGGGGAGGGPAQSCDQCVQNNQFKCQGQINACLADSQCQQFLDCVQNQDPDVCQQKFPKGVPGYQKIIQCLVCGACGGECANEIPPGFCAMGL